MIYLDEVLNNETQNTMKIKKTFVKENPDLTLKEIYPELFEVKKFTGWAKSKKSSKVMLYYEDSDAKYGINYLGTWKEKAYAEFNDEQNDIPATPKEVETALIEEAKRRGYKQCYSVVISDWAGKCELNNNGYDFDEKGHLWLGDCRIFVDGVWANIFPQKEVTKQEIAQAFNTTVDLLKIID